MRGRHRLQSHHQGALDLHLSHHHRRRARGPYDKLDKALDAQSASAPLCACRKGATFWFGIKISFWSPDRMVDVVTEPGCMMALGADIMATGGKLQGSQTSIADGTNTRKLFAQMHYYISPVWKMLDMFTDLPCFQDDGFDVALMTEVMPTWQSGALGAIIQPEHPLRQSGGGACLHGRQRGSGRWHRA
jgi:conjugal transfer pilus assembly protein TraU